ncbi:MAG: type IV secretory system conjugative DNA transfer family protein [Gammaproteobacteria bacterium]|nr:type IV secretory system conjugative DNA transfer family protein [Gammaproteobacteria bacterium]MBY0543983.1 type IV secretory system conjugative DNA transfer family protein [Gammaproteobacteria bacterium]
MTTNNWISNIKTIGHRLKADYVERPIFYFVACLIIWFSYWSSGMLGAAMMDMPFQTFDYNMFDLSSMGYHQATFLSGFIVVSVVLACCAFVRGAMLGAIGKNYLKVVLLTMLWASASLYSYKYFYHDNISVMPWHWYSIALLNTPQTSNPKILQLISGGLGFFMIGLSVYLISQSVKSKLGHTHFANVWDVHKSGLFAKEGIVPAKAHGSKLRAPGFEGALIVAPMGSGKTAAVAIPNLVEWRGSVVVNDLKGALSVNPRNF